MFPTQIKEKLERKWKGLNINDYTITLDPWGKGGTHTGIHYPEDGSRYNDDLKNMLTDEISCGDFLKKAFDYIEGSIDKLNQNYPPIGNNPPVCSYRKTGDDFTLDDIRNLLLDKFCNGNSSPQPQPVSPPVLVLVTLPERSSVIDTITTNGPAIVGIGVAVAVGVAIVVTAPAHLGTVVAVGIVAIVGSWWS